MFGSQASEAPDRLRGINLNADVEERLRDAADAYNWLKRDAEQGRSPDDDPWLDIGGEG